MENHVQKYFLCSYIRKVNERSQQKCMLCLMIKATDLLQEVHFFDLFKVNSRPEEYIMSSCSGKMTTSGRRASEFVIESCSGELPLELPTLIECDNLPDNRHEIPTSDVAKFHPHLHDIIPELKPLDDKCQILLLIGRDLPYVHCVLAQRTSHQLLKNLP